MTDARPVSPAPVVGDKNDYRGSLLFGAALLSMLLVALLVYKPGLSGSFLLDDMVNLQQLAAEGGVTDGQAALTFIFGNRSGPAGRPISMASFLLDGQNWPAPGFVMHFEHRLKTLPLIRQKSVIMGLI